MELKKKIKKILLWMQKYTETDMVYLATGGFWLALGKVVFSISGFLLVIVLANFLSKETYGTYQYVLSIAGILAIPTLSGMNNAIVRAVAQGYEGSIVPALKTQIHWGVLGGIASLGVAGYYFFNNNITLTISFLIVAIFIPLMNPFSIYQTFWTGKQRFATQAKYNIIIRIIAISALVSVTLLTKNIIFILGAYFSIYTLLYFIFFRITISKLPPNPKQDLHAISYGKHLSFLDIIGGISSQLDKILLWHFLGAEALAIYFFATAPVQQVKALFKTLRPLALSKFSQYYKKKSKTALFIKVIKSFPIMIFITVAYIVIIPYFYQIFLPQYIKSISYSQLFSLTLLFIPQILLITFLTAQGNTKELYIVQFAFYSIQIILLIILLPIYGILGAVIALITNQILNLALLIFLLRSSRINRD